MQMKYDRKYWHVMWGLRHRATASIGSLLWIDVTELVREWFVVSVRYHGGSIFFGHCPLSENTRVEYCTPMEYSYFENAFSVSIYSHERWC